MKDLTLKELLTEIMTDEQKLEDMMCQRCVYNQNYPVTRWDIELRKYVETGETAVVEYGYARRLDEYNITYEVVDSFGGEGQGDQYWTVWRFTRGDEEVLVSFDGWYTSYFGAEFNDWRFVQPKRVTVTQYV
jgi:hypothetical protein